MQHNIEHIQLCALSSVVLPSMSPTQYRAHSTLCTQLCGATFNEPNTISSTFNSVHSALWYYLQWAQHNIELVLPQLKMGRNLPNADNCQQPLTGVKGQNMPQVYKHTIYVYVIHTVCIHTVCIQYCIRTYIYSSIILHTLHTMS